MKHRTVLFIIYALLIFNSSEYAQNGFSTQINISRFDRGVTVEEVVGSGFIITGYATKSNSGEDVLLIRTDSSGDTLWTKTYGGSGSDNGWAVRQTNDGGFIIGGYTNSFGAGGMDVYLIKTNSKGDTIWTKTFGGPGDEFGWDIRNTTDGGFIIAAQTGSFGNGELDAYLIKTDADGNEEWSKFYGGTKTDRIFSVQQTPDGGYVAVGISYSFTSINSNDRDAYLLKTDSSGEMEWSKTFGGNAYDVGHSVALTGDGGYIITGYGESFANNGTRDVYLIKTNMNGEEEWTKAYGENVDERGIKGYQTSDGGYIVIGLTDRNLDVYLLNTDSVGNLLWTRTFGTFNKVDFGYTARETSDGGFILTGYTSNLSSTESNVLLIKTNQNGIITNISDSENNNFLNFILDQNYPNPFNPKTTITYQIKTKSDVELNIYDVMGQRVKTLVSQKQNPGQYFVTFNASGLPSGVYIYKLETNIGFSNVRKFVLLK